MTWRFSNRNQGVPRDFFDGGSATDPRTKWTMRRDSDANRAETLLAMGEPFWTTDDDAEVLGLKLWVGDGVTLGGIAVAGGADDKKVKVSSADTTAEFLETKLVAGSNLTITKGNTGANEILTLAASAPGVDITGTDNRVVRMHGTDDIQDSGVTLDDDDDLSGVNSISGSLDATSYSTWADVTAYVVDDKRVSIDGQLGKYNCILNHTSDIDRDSPGIGYDWQTYWVALDEVLEIRGPVQALDGMSFNNKQLRGVSGMRWEHHDGAGGYIHMTCPEVTETQVWTLPALLPDQAGVCLMAVGLAGSQVELDWSLPILVDIFAVGTSGQYLITNDAEDNYEWVDRPYDLRAWIPGSPTDAQVVDNFVAARPITFAAAFAGSYAKATTASTGDVSFTVKKNGSNVGTIRFNASATGTFTLAGGMTLAAGDVVSIVAPATADATLADIYWTLIATLPAA